MQVAVLAGSPLVAAALEAHVLVPGLELARQTLLAAQDCHFAASSAVQPAVTSDRVGVYKVDSGNRVSGH